eukprot:4052629-Karenia_brevis.AAC.1
MSIATTHYGQLMNRPVPVHEWLLAVYKLMEKRQRVVEDLTLPHYTACENDEKDVTLVTLPNLD